MKINKIFALLLASTLLAACSDDDTDWNNGTATVSMEQTEISVKENKGIFNVPVMVEGTQNGPIRVTVEVAESGTEPAMDDVHYYVTSKTILIPADATSGNIEICTVDDEDINASRTFTVTITKAEGATIGTNATTTVMLKDNDSAFYEKLQGKWKMSATSPYTGAVSWDVNVIGYEENENGYNEVLYITGMMGYSFTQATLLYQFDMATKKVTLSFALGTKFAEAVGFTDGKFDVYLGTADNGHIVVDGTIDGECSEDFKTITFDASKTLYFFLAPAGTSQLTGSLWDAVQGITMTKN